MHSMAVRLAADTASPSPPAIGGWGIAVVAVVLLLVARKKKTATEAAKQPGSIRAVFGFLVAVLRFYGGRELRGGPRSDAGVLRWGKPRSAPRAEAVTMESIALAPPKVDLVKAGPRPWAGATAAWIETYDGRGARTVDGAVRAALWAVRAAGATWRALTAVYGVSVPIVATIARVVRLWYCWPYAARGAARVAMTAAVLGLLVPGWRVMTVVLLALALGAAAAVAHRLRPGPLGDDAVYGPRLWVILREDLGLPEHEARESWLRLPGSLAAPDARIVLRLPWTFRGSQAEKDALGALISSRVPGEWVGRFVFTGEHATAVYTHKPPPKPREPEPECPERVGFFDPDIQEAIAACKKGEVVVGKDASGRIVIKKLDGETPHWALSVGTGGGKSAFCQMVIAQLIRQGYHIMAADVKRVSVDIYIGVPGVYVYNDPMNAHDMRAGIEWAVEEISARSAIAEADKSAEFPGLLILIEEANEFADVSREWWDENRKTKDDEDGPKDRAADSIWGTVASGARLGRHVHGNIIAIFQDLRDQALGGKGLRNLFRLKLMGNFTVNSWKNVIGTTPVPESVDKAGRMMVAEGNSQYWVQTCFAEPEELRVWAIKQREATGFDPAVGLWGTAPKPSPKRLPRLLQGVSRDKLPEALRGVSEGGLSGETAGHGVTVAGGVTGDVTASRDRLRLIPGQRGQGAAEAPEDPAAPPQLLTLAEIARELEKRGIEVKENTMRQHKRRRASTGFPVGIEVDGSEKFTLGQIVHFYQKRGVV